MAERAVADEHGVNGDPEHQRGQQVGEPRDRA